MKLELDWRRYQDQGMGDPYAGIPRRGGDFAKAIAVCNNSAVCEQQTKGVMCPSYRINPQASLSPRGRVSLFKKLLNHANPKLLNKDPELFTAMDECISCKGCKRECDNSLDMAQIKVEYLAQRLKSLQFWKKLSPNALRSWIFAEWPFLLYRHAWMKWGIRYRNHHSWLARVMERCMAIGASVPLPEPAKKPFYSEKRVHFAKHNRATNQSVVLLVDTFTALFQPKVAEDALALLLNAGYSVWLIQPQQHFDDAILDSGRTLLSQGRVKRARQEAVKMLDALAPHIKLGRKIIGLEPSALLMFRDEYQALDLGEQVEKLAKLSVLLEEFIAQESVNGRFKLQFKSAETYPELLVHGHCHQKAVGALKSVRKVLRLIPNLNFDFIESSCCGMAGTYGMEKEHVMQAQHMAQLSLLPRLAQQPQAMILSTGFSCGHQIQLQTGRYCIHLASFLAELMSVTNEKRE